MMMMILITTKRGWEKLIIRKLINSFQSLYQFSVFTSSLDSKCRLPPSEAIWIVAFKPAAAAKFLTVVLVFQLTNTGMPARKTGKLMIRTMMVVSIINAPLHILSTIKVKTEIHAESFGFRTCTHFLRN